MTGLYQRVYFWVATISINQYQQEAEAKLSVTFSRIGTSILLSLGMASGLFAQPPATGAKSKGKVYVYRYKQYTGSALKPSVYSDDQELARIENGRFFALELDPGEYTLRSNDKQSGVRVKVEAGKRYFIRVELANGFLKGHGRVVLVAPEQGIVEIQKLKPLSPDKVKNSSLVSIEEAPDK